MISKILVPLDGSTLAERAIPVAENLARRLAAGIVLIHCTGVSRLSSPERYLDQVRSDLSGAHVDIETAVPEGEAVVQILRAADIYRADLIVMTRRGRSEVGRWLMGSVTAGVLRRASVPVILVPSAAAPMIGHNERLTILLPLDGSVESESALATGVAMAADLAAQVVLFRAVSGPDSDSQLW